MTPQAIAFMHIPKTAGLSVVGAFERVLGPERCRRQTPSITDQDFETYQFVSGHHWLSAITPKAWRFTFLRDPVAQLASHLRWLDHYNEPKFRSEALGLSREMRHIVVRVGQTDFDSAAEIDRLFDWLPENAPALLSKVQCFVLARHPSLPRLADPSELAAAAISNLQQLDFVGLTEHLEQDMARLFHRLALIEPPELRRDNSVSSARYFDLRNATIRAALENRMQADLRLYDHVLRSVRR